MLKFTLSARYYLQLNVLKHSKVYDNSNKEFSLFVVPLRKINQNYSLNWEIIKSDFCKVKKFLVSL